MSLYVRSAGVYQPVDFDELFRKNGGIWVKLSKLYVRVAGIYQEVWSANSPPPAPGTVGRATINGGKVNVTWTWPANPENDYVRVEVQNRGLDTARVSTNYPGTLQQRTGYAHGATVDLEARTVDTAGLTSGWVAVGAIGAINAAPGAPGSVAMVSTGAAMRVTWNNPGNPYSDITNVQIHYRQQDEGTWTLGHDVAYSGGSKVVDLPYRAYDKIHYALVRIVGPGGFTDSPIVSAWSPPPPGTERTIAPQLGDSFGFTAMAWRNDGTVRMGQFSPTPWGNHYGGFFYGANSLWNMGHGHQAVSGEILMIRQGSEGFSGPVTFLAHANATRPPGAPNTTSATWPSSQSWVGADVMQWEPLPAGMLAEIASGAAQGLGIYTASTLQANYRVFRSPSTNGFAGVVRLRW